MPGGRAAIFVVIFSMINWCLPRAAGLNGSEEGSQRRLRLCGLYRRGLAPGCRVVVVVAGRKQGKLGFCGGASNVGLSWLNLGGQGMQERRLLHSLYKRESYNDVDV